MELDEVTINPKYDSPNRIDCNEDKCVEYFELFFNDTIYQKIVTESKRYFEEKFKYIPNKKYQKNTYGYLYSKYDIKIDDIKAFISLMIFMGISKLPSVDMYWSSDKIFETNFPKRIMSKNYFKFLSTALHIPESQKAKDRPEQQEPRIKILWLIEELIKNFKANFTLGNNICIDESIVLFKGKQKLKFYMPNKPTKWGFKLHLLCDSDTSYVYDLIFDPTSSFRGLIVKDNFTIPESIILKLTENLRRKTLYLDAWYSSIRVSNTLIKLNSILCTGVLRDNAKNIPDEFKRNKNITTVMCENARLFKFHDNKSIIFISTDPQYRTIEDIPKIQENYNLKAKAIDQVNQFASYYSFNRKSLRWWKKIFYFLIEVAISNAIIIKEEKEHKKINNLEFRKKLMLQLVKNFSIDKETDKPSHFSFIPLKYLFKLHEIQKSHKRRRCCACSNKTAYHCPNCDKNIHPECFKNYHVKHIYSDQNIYK